MKLLLVSAFVAVATCIPFQNNTSDPPTPVPLSPQDYAYLNTLPRHKSLPAGFKYIYVGRNGQITTNKGAYGTQVEIAGSPRSSMAGLRAAANVVALMSKYMPSDIFSRLTTQTSLGVFTASEKLTIFPEYYNLASGNCGSSCSGSCSRTCTFDGRKYEDIAGVGGRRGVVLEDNVLCNSRDPYRRTYNVLSHEYTHTIHQYALPSSVKSQITSAYQAAKRNRLWGLSSYTMSNDLEYFAVAATVWFNVAQAGDFGGINLCGSSYCRSESQGRNHLLTTDRPVYNLLSYVFDNNNPSLPSGLTMCPSSAVIG